MGIGHSRKNFPIMPCASLPINNTKAINNKKQDAEFVFQQLWKAFGLGGPRPVRPWSSCPWHSEGKQHSTAQNIVFFP